MSLAAHIIEQARAVHRNPSDGQKKAGNYRKGHVRFHGLDISIENPRGSYRAGTGEDGKPWRSRLPHHYGYIRGTEGSDGDHVDVFIGPHVRSGAVYVIDQKDLASGAHDEHKVMMGFASEKQAREAYKQAFSDGKGGQRIASVEGMTVEQFKDWLKGSAIRRAAGGRVGYAEGGAPAFDPDQPSSEVPPYREDAGSLDAFGRGAAQGATFNLGDEIAGAYEIGPRHMPSIGPVPGAVLRTGVGAVKSFLGNDEEKATYEKRRDEVRKANEAAKANHPYWYTGGEFVGAVPAIAATPEAGAVKALAPTATRAVRAGANMLDSAVQGGIYGGLTGAGSGKDLGERAMEGAKGIVSGIIGGGAASAATGVARAAYDKFGAPIVNTIKGWVKGPEAEASRRLGVALQADQDLIQQGKAKGLTWQQWVQARRNGEPVTLAELGSSRTQALLRSAANTSPEGRAQLEKMIEDRFHAQSERVGETVRNILPGGRANARKTADQLVAEYDQARVPAYQRAYEEGDRPIFTRSMEKLTSSPTVVAAMRRALSSGRDRDVTMGFGGFNPKVNITEDGRIIWNKGADGMPIAPNLQFWDQVKRELDSAASQARRSGDTSSVAGDLAKILRNELDTQVKSYKAARGIAEDFFGEKNALEAGRALAGKKPVAEDVADIMRKMDPQERALFREGYASDLAERVIGKMKDTQDVTKAMFNSPNERKLAATIFGPGGMAQLQARMALETIMDGARQAMGNSSTARQLIEAGLAGGAGTLIGGYGSGWDPYRTAETAGAFAGARFGAGKYLPEQIKVGAKHLIGKVDAATARKVAEMLTSDDPRVLRKGLQLASSSNETRNALIALANRMFMSGQAQAREPFSAGVKALQGAVPGRAEEQQQQ